MPVARYVSEPVEIDAIQWTSDNAAELAQWCGWCFSTTPNARLYVAANHAWLDLEYTEWVAKDSEGFYPIKNIVFQRKYKRKQAD